MRSRVTATILAVAVLAGGIAMPGCGGDDATTAAAGSTTASRVTVFAAASLAGVLPALTPGAAYSFAGSDRLAFQIEQGAPADVFASASPRYTDALHAKGLVERPVTFARNELVLIVPRANPAGIRSVRDLAARGVKLVVGDASVPVGAYSRVVLGRLGLGAALANVVSNEPDVRGVVAKVAAGEADAGIAYRTDLRGTRGRVAPITIPASAQPAVAYTVAVTTSARHPAEARAFIDALRGPRGRRVLREFGFRTGG